MYVKVIILSLMAVGLSAAQKRIVCYYGSWAAYRPGEGKFDVENIDPHLCTHVIYTFVGLGSDNRLVFLDPLNDLPDNGGRNAIGRIVNLKIRNPSLKVMLAVGGWNEGSTKYSQMVATGDTRRTFIESVLEVLRKYNFDGFDLDWEYPTQRGGVPADKVVMGGKYILSAAVGAGCKIIEESYDVRGVSKHLDFINLMTYDLHGSWENFTGHHTQLYPSDLDSEDAKCHNTYDALNLWLKKGAPPEKINLGLALYGRGWVLSDASVNGLHAPASAIIPPGSYTGEVGFWGYNEICERQINEQWTVVRNAITGGPYAYRGNLWIGYDDPESIVLKAQFAMDRHLGGVMTWSIESDDFRGNCGGGTFPLIKAMRRVVNASTSQISGTPHVSASSSSRNVSQPWTALWQILSIFVMSVMCHIFTC